MKTNHKITAYILRGSVAVVLFSCVIVAICWAIGDQFGNPSTGLTVSYTVKGARPACVPPPPDMVSWWPGDGNTDDIVGSNNGTLHNGATFAPGMVDQAFSFDGIDDYVQATDTGLPFGAAARTLDFWMKPMVNARIPVIYGDFLPNDAFYVLVQGANACIGQWGGGDVCGSTDVTDGSWHHIALTYDGVSSAVLYVDGALETSAAKNYTTTQTGTLLIGGTIVSGFDYFDGLVDEVEIFSRALSQPEIQAIVNAGSAGKCKPQGTPTPTPTCTPSGLLIVAGQTNEFYDYAELNDIVQYSFAQSQARPNQFAVFRTHSPWGETYLTNHITADGYTYTIFTPAQLVGFNFAAYRVMVLDWSDTESIDFDPPYTSVIPALETYISNGGVVWIEGAIQNGFFPLPFGGTATYNTQNDNFIVDTSSPMVAGMPNPFQGDAASHVVFSGYPGNAHVVVVGGTMSGGPTTLYELRPSGPCGTPTATATPTATVTATATSTPTASATATAILTPTATVTPTTTATATPTASATATGTPSSTPRPTPTPRARPTPAPRP